MNEPPEPARREIALSHQAECWAAEVATLVGAIECALGSAEEAS
jgi:hypothetical protein